MSNPRWSPEVSDESKQSKATPPSIPPAPAKPIPSDETQPQVSVQLSQAVTFSGPLPPPEILHEYNKALKGAAERIFAMAEAQAKHRQELEKRIVQSDILKSYLGLGAGFLIAAIAIICGAVVAANDQPWAGAAIGGAPVAALVWAFLRGTNHRREQREAKSHWLNRQQNVT